MNCLVYLNVSQRCSGILIVWLVHGQSTRELNVKLATSASEMLFKGKILDRQVKQLQFIRCLGFVCSRTLVVMLQHLRCTSVMQWGQGKAFLFCLLLIRCLQTEHLDES